VEEEKYVTLIEGLLLLPVVAVAVNSRGEGVMLLDHGHVDRGCKAAVCLMNLLRIKPSNSVAVGVVIFSGEFNYKIQQLNVVALHVYREYMHNPYPACCH